MLLVDDEPSFRAQLREVLTDYGIVVVAEAGSGLEGVEVARRLRPDVVLMDLRMPEMDGITATRLLGCPARTIVDVVEKAAAERGWHG